MLNLKLLLHIIYWLQIWSLVKVSSKLTLQINVSTPELDINLSVFGLLSAMPQTSTIFVGVMQRT
jgi:hypothetical protein